MRALSVAALQVPPVVGDPEATLVAFKRRVRALHDQLPGLQLVVAPEHHLPATGGIGDDGPPEDELAAAIPGPLTDRLAALARETGLWLVPGSIVERAHGGGVHNTAVVLSPDGEVAATYRKCFPWLPYERIVPGRSLVTFDMPGVGRIGLAICHDGAFPEVFRQLAWLGAEVVLQPTLTSTSDRAAELVLAQANAIVNQLYLVNVNAPSPIGLGRSLIVDPEGLVRAEAGSGTEVLSDVLDLDAVTRVRRHGSFGLNRLLDELDEIGPTLELPMYGGIVPRRS